MRHTTAPDHGTWARYLAAALEQSKLSKAEFARRADVDVGTVFRWLSGRHRPEKADVVARIASAANLDLDEVLAAAGLRPNAEPIDRPARQEPPLDPRAQIIAENLQIMSDRLNDPTITNDERLLIEAQLDMLVDLARQRAARRRAKT